MPLVGTSIRSDLNTVIPAPVLIYERMRAQPDTIAIVDGRRQLTYCQLRNLTNRIRERLYASGIQKRDTVMLFMRPSAEFVAAALAVMSIGATYLPVAQGCPPDRLLFMIADSSARLLVSTSGTSGEILLPPTLSHFEVDENLTGTTTEIFPDTKDAELSSLAYLIYTSGSTGTPKGVEITHRSLSHLIDWHNRAFCITQYDRTSQIASLGFDAAVWEIWPCLVAGATLHIAEDADRKDLMRLKDWLQNERITVAFVSTVFAEGLLQMRWGRNTALRLLLTGGEALRIFPPNDLPFTVVNNYGLTECTVVSTSAVVAPNDDRAAPPPIGFPIDHTEIYILREDLKPVAPGEAGEIYIGGLGLALGYRNRPALTAGKFVPNPFDGTPGARLFRTGDLGKWLDNGQIQFHGRLDNQVKIRGFRIELAEIEATINRHSKIKQCAVTTRGEGGEKELIAYLVPTGSKIDLDEMRGFLGKTLPNYMIPTEFVFLHHLPLNLSGKIDYRALPPPAITDRPPEQSIASHVDLQKQIAAIACNLLKVDQIGPEDNLFLFGGHSLFAAQLIARLRERFHIEIQLLSLFQSPTVAKLAMLIEEGIGNEVVRAAAH